MPKKRTSSPSSAHIKHRELIENIDDVKVTLRQNLIRWFRKQARDLPWRKTSDPYLIWLSEIMLQQTQVKTVIPYFERFIAAFPTVYALAHAKSEHVLKLWEGLGYYRRAQNIMKAAQMIVNDYSGKFPMTASEIEKLPGVGRYTAGAIASIAFGESVPVLDGNIKRVFSRLFAFQESIDQPTTVQSLWTMAERLVHSKEPGTFNQALMELGANVCLPKNPQCLVCPVQSCCVAYSLGIQHSLPIRNRKKPIPHVQVVAAAIKKNGRYLLGQRPPGGMLEGLWEFPGGKVEPGESLESALERELLEELGIQVSVGQRLISVDHTYTHLKVTLHLFACETINGKPHPIYHSALKWVPRSQFDQYAFPAANHKFFCVL